MAATLRLTAGTLLLLSTVAIGAPDDGDALIEKSVFPLFGEDDLWWAGVGDVCEIAGAKFEGHRFCEINDAGLGGNERALQPQRNEPHDGSDVDDSAGALGAHDLAGGKQLWLVRPGTHKGEWGFSNEPVLYKDKVIIDGDSKGESFNSSEPR